MWKYIVKNAITSIIVLFITLFIAYLTYVSLKGNPFKVREIEFGNDPAGYARLLKQYGLDLPPIERTAEWFAGLFQGNFGRIYTTSVTTEESIVDASFKPYVYSAQVQVPAYVITLILGFGLGITAGYLSISKKRIARFFDSVVNLFVLLFSSVPTIILGVFALWFASYLKFPSQFETKAGLEAQIRSLVFPILVAVLTGTAYYVRNMRLEVARVLTSDQILAARTRGFSELFIFRRYVFRNSIYPFAGDLSSAYMVIFGSSFVLERYFNIPGTALLFLGAADAGEVNLLMFNTFFFGLLSVGVGVFSNAAQLSVSPLVRANFGSDFQFHRAIGAYFKRKDSKIKGKERLAND